MDFSPPGSSVHGILQARILDWVALPSSQGIFLMQGSNWHLALEGEVLTTGPLGKSFVLLLFSFSFYFVNQFSFTQMAPGLNIFVQAT